MVKKWTVKYTGKPSSKLSKITILNFNNSKMYGKTFASKKIYIFKRSPPKSHRLFSVLYKIVGFIACGDLQS